MLRRLLLILLISFLLCPVFAMYQPDMRYAGAGEVIPVGSQLYDHFDNLFILCGLGSPNSSRPWTVAEARSELSKVNEASLSGYAKDLYDLVSSAIAETSEGAVIVEMTINPEIYLHTDSSVVQEADWVYGYTHRSPLAYGGVNAYNKGFFFHTELSYGIGLAGPNDTYTTLSTIAPNGVGSVENEYGMPGAIGDLEVVSSSKTYGAIFGFNGLGPTDVEIPRNAYVTYATDNFSVGAYRGQKVWGRSKLGNFIYDEHVERYQYFSAKSYSKKFSFDFTIMFPEPYLGGTNEVSDYGDMRRFFLTHRLDVQIRKNLRLTLSENVMYLAHHFADFQFMNPGIIFHNNVNGSQFNAIAHVELEYAPAAGYRIYAQLGVDQGTVPIVESARTEDQAMGLSLGFEYASVVKDGVLALNAEAVYTTPALYRRSAPDFIITTSSQALEQYKGVPFFTYVGFKDGGDTLAARFDADYRSMDLHLYANQTLMLKGGFDMYDVYTPGMFVGQLLTDNRTFTSITNAGVEYSFKAFKKVDCTAFADASLVLSGDIADIQLACGIKTSISSRKK